MDPDSAFAASERKIMAEPSSLDARALLAAAYPVGALVDGRDVLAVRVPAGTALEAWRLLKALHGETGRWPFLTDPKRDERRPTVWENFADYRQVVDDEAVPGDVPQLFARWQAQYLEIDEDDDPFDDEEDREELLASRRCGPLALPAAEPARGSSWAAATTEIGLCPARPGGIEIPHLMEWSGACNYDITGAEHEAVLGHWRQQYGAELLTLTHDVIELAVPRPPTDPADVAQVAQEQTAYCPDIVDQGVGTITALAEQQVYSHLWFFWWD